MTNVITQTKCYFNWQGFTREIEHLGQPRPIYEMRLMPRLSAMGGHDLLPLPESWVWELDEYSAKEVLENDGIRYITYSARYRHRKEPWELEGLN